MQNAAGKIELLYQENTAYAFVYDVNDWETLRKQYRIVGELFGHTQFTPALPLRLYPEEVTFIVKNNIARLVKYPKLCASPTEQDKKVMTSIEEKLFNQQKDIYVNLRKEELANTSAEIVAGRRKCGDQRSEEDILQEELQKSSTVTAKTMIWPTLTKAPQAIKGESTELPLDMILKYTTKTKYLVFEDLWKKGFYITPGQKFGADFLVYSGDPILFHAIYMVRCVEDCDKTLHSSEIVAFGRLGTSVKKKAVLASVKADGTVAYITMNWMYSATS